MSTFRTTSFDRQISNSILVCSSPIFRQARSSLFLCLPFSFPQ
jgi:hypothetical protein